MNISDNVQLWLLWLYQRLKKGNSLSSPSTAGEAIQERSHFRRQHPRCFVFHGSLHVSSVPLLCPSHLSFQCSHIVKCACTAHPSPFFLCCRLFLIYDEPAPFINEVHRWWVTSQAILYPFQVVKVYFSLQRDDRKSLIGFNYVCSIKIISLLRSLLFPLNDIILCRHE